MVGMFGVLQPLMLGVGEEIATGGLQSFVLFYAYDVDRVLALVTGVAGARPAVVGEDDATTCSVANRKKKAQGDETCADNGWLEPVAR